MSSRLSSILQMRRQSPTRYFQNSPSFEPCKACPMLRGLSNRATRSSRNFRMRLLCCGSSLPSSRSTWAESSIFRAMPLQSILKWDGLLFPGADTIQGALGLIQVLKVVQVFEDGLADVEGLGAAGAAGELFQAFLDGLWESNGQHGNLAIQV